MMNKTTSSSSPTVVGMDMTESEGHDDDDETEDVCCICLIPFEPDDLVGRSANPDCLHLYHQKCIEEWLVKSNECPCCRGKFLDDEAIIQDQPSSDVTDV
jgi:hypothetical protein